MNLLWPLIKSLQNDPEERLPSTVGVGCCDSITISTEEVHIILIGNIYIYMGHRQLKTFTF